MDLSCFVSDGSITTEQHLWFESNVPLPWDGDSVVLALATLCGRVYSHISFEIGAQESTKRVVEEFTSAKVEFGKVTKERSESVREGVVLNFSGGFDSLAALTLMPEKTFLTSMDFGGNFARERPYFETFPTVIISTNLTDTALRSNSWSFMGIGSILTQNYYRARYISFGGILENTADGFRRKPMAATHGTFPIFKAAGYENAAYVAGITEIGTAKLLATYKPDAIAASLKSLANPGSEKLYRKTKLVEAISPQTLLDYKLPETVLPREVYPFGKSFTADFVALWLGAKLGRDVRDNLIEGVPDKVDRVIDSLTFRFAERTNPTLYEKFPAELRGNLIERLYDAGMGFYTEDDWEEFITFRKMMAPYYPTLNS